MTVKEALVAPLIAVPFLRHWYDSGAAPVAVTAKVAFAPIALFRLAGWLAMVGGVVRAVTEREAEVLTA